ncbi:type VI secretion system-associated FHA domain protein [Ramlibacter sp. PS3R-8]|uniref:type VI secretion system-associated FHA domain protein n=1 Tax=Ramlibacter sp. PS3R-8 TaxID=3133437 RepID=UPI0030A93671
MALDLHISGPGFDVTRRLKHGDPALILGRDTDCSICLPDPERNVSRRHLSVWNEQEQLHFHVLSVVNGVEIPAGELPPGARGILAPGHAMYLSAYRVMAQAAGDDTLPEPPPASATAGGADPWAEFERQAAGLTADTGPETVPFQPDDDPFGDWGFNSTFGPGSPGGVLRADALAPATDLKPFFAGLGMEAAGEAAFTQGELETIGRLTRIAMQALLQVSQAAALSRHDVRADERTVVEARETNPLRMDSPLETKLYFLFGGQAAAAGFLPPDRAVAQVATELAAHQQAMSEAVREAIEGLLEDFEPEALKARLLGSGVRLFESARAWDAFTKDYAEHKARQPEWVQQLLDRHFTQAYVNALLRAKRNTSARTHG